MKNTSEYLAPVFGFAVLAVLGVGMALPAAAASDNATFKGEVLPILLKHCSECHAQGGQGEEASGLNLTSYEGLMKGTSHGAIVVPGDAFLSNIMVLIDGRAGPELKMPHGRKDLSRWEKTLLRRWINRGAQNN